MSMINAFQFDNKYNFEVRGVSYIGTPKDGTVLFIKKKVAYLLNNLFDHERCLVFVEKGIEVDEILREKNCLLEVAVPDWEYCKVAQELAADIEKKNIDRKYRLAEGCYYIGEDVQIGTNSYIEPGCFIGHDVIIGNNCTIHSGARLEHCTIGDNVIIRQNSVIGVDAFTLAKDSLGNAVQIPSFGDVVIKNHVDIGPLASIYRGELGSTVIEEYVKIDGGNFIGHDAYIGQNCELTASCILGGFATIQPNTYIGIGSIVKNRIIVEKNSFLCMGSVCTQDVSQGSKMFGNPAKKILAPKS